MTIMALTDIGKAVKNILFLQKMYFYGLYFCCQQVEISLVMKYFLSEFLSQATKHSRRAITRFRRVLANNKFKGFFNM